VAYASLEDLRKLLPLGTLVALTDDEGLGTVNEGRVEEALKQAQAEVDGYLGGRYRVPLSPVPEAARRLTADIALYNLYARTVEAIPETRRERYRNAVRQLEAVARGEMSLGVEPAPSAPADSSAESSTPTDGRTFSREKLEGF
jgi:phage gp36-like protein